MQELLRARASLLELRSRVNNCSQDAGNSTAPEVAQSAPLGGCIADLFSYLNPSA
jgi:hypothetical protein